MKNKKIIYSAGLIIIVAAAVITFATNKSTKFNFRTISIARGNINKVVTATGQLSAVKTVEVGTQVSGTIMKLNADFNSKVRKGEIIAVLDTNMLSATVGDAEANLNHLKAQLIEAKTNYDQEKTLFGKNLVSKIDYYTALSNYKSLIAQEQQASADLRKAVINLNYATIRAPINGIVISRNVDVGQTVAASLAAPTLFTIANDLRKMEVQADVDEADIGSIKVGQKVSFNVDAYPDEIFHGIVSQVRLSPQEVQNVVNYTVIINVNNGQLKLMPGMTATVSIKIAHADSVLEVPDIAFYFQPASNMIDRSYLKNEYGKGRFNGGEKAGGRSTRSSSGFRPHRNLQYAMMSNPDIRTLYMLDKNDKIYPVRVKTGLDDGTDTQIVGNRVGAGEQVVIGTLSSKSSTGSGVNPFAPQRKFRRRNGGR